MFSFLLLQKYKSGIIYNMKGDTAMKKIYLVILTAMMLFTTSLGVQAKELWYPYGDADGDSYAEMIKEAYQTGNEEALYSYLNTTVILLLKDAYSTEYLEYMFNQGENVWLKEIAIANGKYPYNDVSEDTSHFSMYTTAEKGYHAEESAGSGYPSNQIMDGLYYVDGTVSDKSTDAGKKVDIECFLHPEAKRVEKDMHQYVVNAEEIEIWEYPTKLAEVIGHFYYGDEVHITGMTEDEHWYEVELEGKNAYIENAYLGDTLEALIVDVTEDGIIYYGEMTPAQIEQQNMAAEAINNAKTVTISVGEVSELESDSQDHVEKNDNEDANESEEGNLQELGNLISDKILVTFTVIGLIVCGISIPYFYNKRNEASTMNQAIRYNNVIKVSFVCILIGELFLTVLYMLYR